MDNGIKYEKGDIVNEFLDLVNHKYSYDINTTEETDVVCDFIKDIKKNKLSEQGIPFLYDEGDGDTNDLEYFYRAFHHLNIESREIERLVNGVEKYIELIHVKTYLSNKIIDTLSQLEVNNGNKERVEYLMGLILNDDVFLNTYLAKDNSSKDVIENVIMELGKFKQNGLVTEM